MGEKRTELALRRLDEGQGLLPQPGEGEAVATVPLSLGERPDSLEALSLGLKGSPKDSYNLLYMILVLHGVGTLMPWNMFINAKSYFTDYKLAVNISSNVSYEDDEDSLELKEYSINFLGYITLASQLPNLLCNFLNLFLQFGQRSLTPRIVISILVEVTIFIATVVLAMVDSTHWPITFFYLTMGLVVVLNMASGVYQNSIFGVAAPLPGKYSNAYSNAVVLGSNISGTLTSLLNIFSIAASPSARTAAIYYFLSALLVLLLCLDSYFALPLLPFYRYHQQLANRAARTSSTRSKAPPYWLVFKQVQSLSAGQWPPCVRLFPFFFCTRPSYLTPAVSECVASMFPRIAEKYFTAVACFFGFNFFAMLGSILPTWIRWPGPRFLWVPVVLRLVFLPIFLLCNYLPKERQLPVWIASDWAYMVAMAVFAWSSGYLSSLAMMYAPRVVRSPQHAPVAGMMAAFCLVLGIFVGGNAAFLGPRIVKGDWF
ncbi:unnamed protein product [Ixodes persulcatus]